MSFIGGTGAFGNYDRSAQTGGMPLTHRTLSHEAVEEESTAAPSTAPLHRPQSKQAIPTKLNELPHTPDNDIATLIDEKGTPRPTGTPKLTDVNEKGGGTDSESDSEDDRAVAAERSSLVQHLARQYTNKSHASGITGANPFAEHASDPDSPLNPSSSKFSARVWAKNVLDLITSEGHTFRTSGIAFQNLNVFGYGAGTDYQKSVANVWLGIAESMRGLFRGKKGRIDILSNFDGVVHNGEMLVVLGPPGSGCSTLLKTVAGEMNGIYVEDSSYFNYQGKYGSEPNTLGVGTTSDRSSFTQCGH